MVVRNLYPRRRLCSSLDSMAELFSGDLERLHGAELRQLGDAIAGMMLQTLKENTRV